MSSQLLSDEYSLTQLEPLVLSQDFQDRFSPRELEYIFAEVARTLHQHALTVDPSEPVKCWTTGIEESPTKKKKGRR
tara:strand:- start:876 stop:1106 length:231 start_codon:yes stop_codon:yes gene_type:complete